MNNINFLRLLISLVFLSLYTACAHKIKAYEPLQERRVVELANEPAAINYLFEKRLHLLRFYELSSEPYFGTPAEKNCKDNIDIKGDIIKIPGGQYFEMQILVNDYRAIGDCLRENNTQNARYQFAQCGNKVIETKLFYAFEQPDLKLSIPVCN